MTIPEQAEELNDWIYNALLRLNKTEEALTFINTHSVTCKRIKKFFLYTSLKKYKEAITYFNEQFSDEELTSYPLLLKIQADNYVKRYGTQKGIDYLLSKEVDKMFMSNELCVIYNVMAKYYEGLDQYETAKLLYTKVLNFSTGDKDAQIGLENIKQKEASNNKNFD